MSYMNHKFAAANLVKTSDPVNHPISLDDLRAFVPSVLAESAHASRSSRYGFLSTQDVLQALDSRFAIVQASQSRVRKDATRAEYTKHMLRLRARDTAPVAELGGVFPELVLVNSHDGTSAYKLTAGLFRLVCSNGMVICDSTFGAVSLRHNAEAAGDIIDASYSVVETANQAISRAKDWTRIELSRDVQQDFAERAHAMRFGDESNLGRLIAPERLLYARRPDDYKNNLWAVTNRIQENVIKGGLRGFAHGRGRITSSRAVTGVDQDLRLNKAIWAIAEDIAAAA